eukprot:403373285
MFKHAFHGGPAVEVLTVSGKNPLEKWKTTGTIGKPFESTMKGYIFTLDGQSKIKCQKMKKSLQDQSSHFWFCKYSFHQAKTFTQKLALLIHQRLAGD